jgi:hypothetical protein
MPRKTVNWQKIGYVDYAKNLAAGRLRLYLLDAI